jgi:glycosidase
MSQADPTKPDGAPQPGQPDSLAPPDEAPAPIAGPVPGQHPDVMPDFVFGHLAAGPETTRALIEALSGVRHQFQIDPLRPQADAPVTIRATTGPSFPAQAVWLYYTADGSRPTGHGGQATTGTAVPMVWRDTEWSELLWDYLSVWEATIPPQPAGAYVRYQIEAIPMPGSDRAPGFADADPKAAGGLEPVFAYLVDAPTAPAWVHDAVIYHIYLDRFHPGSGGQWRVLDKETGILGGTLRGVTEHLDYIAQLGANTIWLSPVFASPTYHRYDATDLLQVDPALGTNEDLGALVQAAHARGLRVLLDLAANHISNRHPVFQQAQANPAGPYRDWFTFTRWPDEYVMFFSSKGLPRFNNEYPPARAYMLDAVRFWLERYDIDGYRLDYVLGPSHDFWSDYYRTVKAIKPDSFSVAEATAGANVLRSYEGRMDGALDFTFLTMIRGLIAFETIPISAFDRFVTQSARYYSPGFVRATFLDNHDMNRFLWVAKGDRRKLEVAAAIQFTLAGPPIIYYGTEVGIRQKGDVRASGYGRDVEARGPMLWGAEQDAGLLAYYRRLAAIRHAHPAIRHGTRVTLHLDDTARTYAYAQIQPGEIGLLVALNLSGVPRALHLPLPAGPPLRGTPRDLLNGHPVTVDSAGLQIRLPPLAAALVELG